jgi:hypothetical protein
MNRSFLCTYSPERKRLKEVLAELKKEQIDVPMYIGSKEVRTNKKGTLHPPHEIAHTLGTILKEMKNMLQQAIDAALAAKEAGQIWMGNKSQYFFESCRSYGDQVSSLYERNNDAWSK